MPILDTIDTSIGPLPDRSSDSARNAGGGCRAVVIGIGDRPKVPLRCDAVGGPRSGTLNGTRGAWVRALLIVACRGVYRISTYPTRLVNTRPDEIHHRPLLLGEVVQRLHWVSGVSLRPREECALLGFEAGPQLCQGEALLALLHLGQAETAKYARPSSWEWSRPGKGV